MTTTDDHPLAMLARVAETETRRFDGRNLRVRRSPVVHGVRLVAWLGGLTLPAPACGQGWSGAGVGELHPVAEAVTCVNCRNQASAMAAAADAGLARQMPLPLQLG